MSVHYPTDPGPSEGVRELADVILAELRATPRGWSKAGLAGANGASEPQVVRAIAWLRACGVVLRVDRRFAPPRWVLDGERRYLPAHALDRVSLLDALRHRLGDDVDPLDEIDRLRGEVWREVGISCFRTWCKRTGLISWWLDRLGHRTTLIAVAAESAEPIRVAEIELEQPVEAVLAWADWQIARSRATVPAQLAAAVEEYVAW